jgi:hypothetical protein
MIETNALKSSNTMSKFKNTLNNILFILALFSATCQAEGLVNKDSRPLPDSMLGVWQVTSVLTDKGIKGEVQGIDDKYLVPRHLGRIFTISSDQLSINTPGDDVCEAPGLSLQKSTAAKLIANSISTRLFDSSKPTPQDLQLPLVNNAVVDVLYLMCKGKLRAKDEGMSALADLSNVVWFIDLGKNQFAMSWHDQMVLILNRVPDNARPVASFNCAKAGTVVEKTICASVGLAAYDKSLSQTYKLVKAYYKSKPNNKVVLAELKTLQKEWLSQTRQMWK